MDIANCRTFLFFFIMEKTNCRHCSNTCKTLGKTSCTKYNPLSNRPQQLQAEIKQAFAVGDYELGKKLQEELFRLLNG